MMKTRLIAMAMASLVLFYTSCSEKEVEKPVEDTARLDALRSELRSLQVLVYGEFGVEANNADLKAENADYEETLAELQAQVTELKAIYDQTVQYTVMIVDYSGTAISGAEVTLNQNGTIATKTTSATGLVVFEDVRAGALAAVVKATGFTTANYSTTLNNLSQGGASTTVPLLPKSGTQADAAMFTLTGYLYANLNNANDTLSGVDYNGAALIGFKGTPVTGPLAGYTHRSFDVQSKKISATVSLNLSNVPFSIYNTSAAGSIRRIAYEDAVYEGTIDAATGKYSIKLPARAATIQQLYSFSYRFYFEEFSAPKTFVAYDVNGTVFDALSFSGNYFGNTPRSAFPKPQAYTQKTYFRIPDSNYNSFSWGTTPEGALPGSSYAQNFFYSEYLN